MAQIWTLNEATFRPREVQAFFGITTETQRQWRSRGFLGSSEPERGVVSLRDAASMVYLQACREVSVGLELASSIGPMIAGAAKRYAIIQEAPLRFHGTDQEQAEYTQWLQENHLLFGNMLDRWIETEGTEVARFGVIESSRAYPLVNADDPDPADAPITRLMIDAWAIGERLRRSIPREIAWLTKR